MGGPPDHIQSLRAGGYGVRSRGEEKGPMVTEDGYGYPIEGHVKIYFMRCKESESTGIWQAWKEERSAGSGKCQSGGRRRCRGI